MTLSLTLLSVDVKEKKRKENKEPKIYNEVKK